MTVIQRDCNENPARERAFTIASSASIRVGLLGLGRIGSTVAGLALTSRAAIGRGISVTSALVRRIDGRVTPAGVPLTTNPRVLFDTKPDVVVEVLGGTEPARTLVLEAIGRGIPVVTANKSLLAHHGDEIFEAANGAGVALRYEASVIAGVPFLDTFSRRRLAAEMTGLTGIVNGTSNYILSKMDRSGTGYGGALGDAQRLGFAEPDPSKDVGGVDAVEKLVILLRLLAGCSVAPGAIETSGIADITAADIVHARELGGTIKPVVYGRWTEGSLDAFAAPAFVPSGHPLAGLHDATNGLCLHDRAGNRLCFTGPGAGPVPTSITILDDVVEALTGARRTPDARRGVAVRAPSSCWLVRLSSAGSLPPGADAADLLGSYGVWVQRTSLDDGRDGWQSRWLLTYRCPPQRITTALSSLSAATGCTTLLLRALELEV